MKSYNVMPFMGATLPANIRFKPTDDQAARFGDRIKKTKTGAMTLVPCNFKRGETVTMNPDDLPKTARDAFELIEESKGKKPTKAALAKAEKAAESANSDYDAAVDAYEKNESDDNLASMNAALVKLNDANNDLGALTGE